MSEIILKTGWLKDPADNQKFAPKTTTNQVLTRDGNRLTDALNNIQTDMNTHKTKGAIHVGDLDRENWNNAYTHSESGHAPIDSDETVKQVDVVDNANIPVLLSSSANHASNETGETKYSAGVTVNPSTRTVNASSFNATTSATIGNAIITYDAENERLVFSFK